MTNSLKELKGKMPPKAAIEGDKIIINKGPHAGIDGIRPIVIAVYEDGVLACHDGYGAYKVQHGDYFVISEFNHSKVFTMKLERWREEEMELLYDFQEEVANENPGKDAQRYWDAKHAYDK